MAITHSTTARNALCNTAVDLLDTGSGRATGALVFQTAASAEVATLLLSNPAFGAASNGSATAAAITEDSNATGGTTTKFELQDRDSNGHIFGSVEITGGDINLSAVIINPLDIVQVSNLSYQSSV